MAEDYLFPSCLLDEALEPSRPRKWWVLYTKARHEKAVAERLQGHQVPHYLPVVSRTSLCRGRKIRSRVPVFASYLFMYGDDDERVHALTTNRISRMLEVDDGERMRRDLFQLRKLIVADAPLTIESRLTPGQAVRVKGGAFAGMEGVVLSRCRKTRLVIAVNYLQQGVSVEIDDYLLEPI